LFAFPTFPSAEALGYDRNAPPGLIFAAYSGVPSFAGKTVK